MGGAIIININTNQVEWETNIWACARLVQSVNGESDIFSATAAVTKKYLKCAHFTKTFKAHYCIIPVEHSLYLQFMYLNLV